MSAPVSRFDISVPWRCSRTYRRALIGIHFGLCVALLAVPFELWVTLLLGAAVTVNFLYLLWRLRTLGSVQRIGVSRGHWHLTLGNETYSAAPWRAPLLSHWLVILYLKAAGRRWVIPILQDSTPPERFRLLRVYLHLHSEF